MDGRALVQDPVAYISQKYCHSVLLQGIMDYRGKFVGVSMGNVGCDHNAHVLQCSNIFYTMDTGVWVPGNPTLTIEGVIIPALIAADSAYPLQTWLMMVED